MMNEDELSKLESKIYIFSVDVFSFVKTLLDQNFTNQSTSELLKASNRLYTTFLDILDSHKVKNRTEVYLKCIELSKSCADLLSVIEVKGALLNERVDLLIEAKELTRILDSAKSE